MKIYNLFKYKNFIKKMENQRKCSNKKHSELNAVNYCKICNLYLCNKCSNNHLEYLDSHPIYNLA